MDRLLDLLTDGGLCPLFFAALLIFGAASNAVAGRPRYAGLCQAVGGVAALAFAWRGWSRANPASTTELLSLVARSVLVGAVAISLCAFAASVIDVLWGTLVEAPRRRVRVWLAHWSYAWRRRREERHRRREERRSREQEERRRPEDEQRQRERREREQREGLAAGRRQEARHACELLYNLHAPEIAGRLPRASFDEMLRRLLRDELDADVVERRASELQRLVLQHLERIAPAPKVVTLEDVQAWYEAEKCRLTQVADPDLRESLLAALNAKYHERAFQVLDAMS